MNCTYKNKRNKLIVWACIQLGVIMFMLVLPLLFNLCQDTNKKVFAEPIEFTKLSQQIDTIAVKQHEMRDVSVLVGTRRGSGSGTVISCVKQQTKNIWEYRVLTNAHVVYTRFSRQLVGVDAITGKIKTEIVDTGCYVTTFNHNNNTHSTYAATVMEEDLIYDLAMLSFESSEKIAVAKLATDEMLQMVRVFDPIYAIGCQLSGSPTPTSGIISQITAGKNGEKKWIIYSNTAQIAPGSSGGGLFKKYNDHYYLIGIPFSLAIAPNGQIIPHLAHAISIGTAREFINRNLISCQEK